MRRCFAISGLLLACLPVSGPLQAASKRSLALRHVTLDLPGAPAKVIPHDVDGDGRSDLVVVLVYTEVEEIGEDRLENMVQFTTVIPALFDRREIRVYLANETGGFSLAGEPLELAKSVLHLEPGPPGTGLVALTDAGLSRVVFDVAERGATMRLVPLVADVPVLAGTESFYAWLQLVRDLDGDGVDDVLLPSRDALAVHLGSGSGLTAQPAARLPRRGGNDRSGELESRWYAWPDVVEVDGDGHPDLVFWWGFDGEKPERQHVLLGDGKGGFRPLREAPRDCHDDRTDLRLAVSPGLWPWPEDLTDLRDVDGDGRAEAVIQIEQSRGEGFRKGMKDAKRPVREYRFHELDETLALEPVPYFSMEAEGHIWELEPDNEVPFHVEQFQDLDGDGRLDLITFTLDFSIFQALRVLTTKRLSIGVDFHVWAQQGDGSFREVPDLDLSEKLKLNLNDLKIGRFAQFAGDFNGDGRQDFVHLGRGKTVTIHAGQPGCRYPKKPDLSIKLDEEPTSLDLVRIEDLDGDGRADLRITRPLEPEDRDASTPVRLDLYLSGDEP